jgi:Tfp pilus assembly protein PilO
MMPDAARVRAAWLSVALAASLGFAGAIAPAERRIAAIESRAADLAELASRNEALAANARAAEAERARIRGEIDRLAGKGNPGRATVAVLRILADEAARNHLTLTGIAPSGDVAPRRTALREEDVEISLRGRYRDVMEAVADLSRRDALVEVRGVSLARVDAHQLFPSVDATVRAALYHDAGDLAKEETHASTAAQ